MKRVFLNKMDRSSKKEIVRTDNNLTIRWLVLDDEMDSDTNDYETDEECNEAIEETVAELVKEGYIEKKLKSNKEMLKEIESKGAFTISKRFSDFVINNEKEKYSNCSTTTNGIKGWRSGKFLEIIFLEPEYDLFEEMDIDPIFETQGYVALARIRDETDFFAIKVDGPECPVFIRNHEIGKFETYSDSLDAFLKNLKKDEYSE
jgi:hypothetical protein